MLWEAFNRHLGTEAIAGRGPTGLGYRNALFKMNG